MGIWRADGRGKPCVVLSREGYRTKERQKDGSERRQTIGVVIDSDSLYRAVLS